MNKKLTVFAAAALTAVLLTGTVAGAAVPAAADTALCAENCLRTGWQQADSPVVSDRLQKICEQAFAGLLGADYKPEVLLATRRTPGSTGYRILCRMQAVTPGAREQYVIVTLHKPLLGSAAVDTVTETQMDTDLGDASGMLAGGWTKPDTAALTAEQTAAFDAAMQGLTGVSYKPLALLSTQVVAGVNYRFLCEATAVYPGAEPYYAVVTVYQALDGTAQILDITDLPNS